MQRLCADKYINKYRRFGSSSWGASAGMSYAAYRYATIGGCYKSWDALSGRSTRIEAQRDGKSSAQETWNIWYFHWRDMQSINALYMFCLNLFLTFKRIFFFKPSRIKPAPDNMATNVRKYWQIHWLPVQKANVGPFWCVLKNRFYSERYPMSILAMRDSKWPHGI